jgi:hypothetical protein
MTSIIDSIKREMEIRGIDILYGVFKERVLQNILNIFNEINKENVTLDSFHRFSLGVRSRCKPNREHQLEIGMKRKTYYKLINFLESLSPKSWVCSALDKRRLQKGKVLTQIKNKILDKAPDSVRLLWEAEINRCQKYSREVLARKRKARIAMFYCDDWNPEREYTRTLRPLKRRVNRLPLIEREITLFSLLKMIKKRPCPLTPYKTTIRLSGRINVEAWYRLMSDIRNIKFDASYNLKKESLNLNQQRNLEKEYVDKAIAKEKHKESKRKKRERDLEKARERDRIEDQIRQKREEEKKRKEEELIEVKRLEVQLHHEQLKKEKEAEKVMIREKKLKVNSIFRRTESYQEPKVEEASRSTVSRFFGDLNHSRVVTQEAPIEKDNFKDLLKIIKSEMISEIKAMTELTEDMRKGLEEFHIAKSIEKIGEAAGDSEKRDLTVKTIRKSFKDAFSSRKSALTRQRKRELKENSLN